jgi:hypothetical protein
VHPRPRAAPGRHAPRRHALGPWGWLDSQFHFFLAPTNDEFQRASFDPGALNGCRQLFGAMHLVAIHPQDLITTAHAGFRCRGVVSDFGNRQLPAFTKVECDADFETTHLASNHRKPKHPHSRATGSAPALSVAAEGIRPAIGLVLLGHRPLGLHLQSLSPRPGFLGFALRLFHSLPKLLTVAGTLLADRLGIPIGRIGALRPLLSRLRRAANVALCPLTGAGILHGRQATTDQIENSTAHLGRYIGRFERFGDAAKRLVRVGLGLVSANVRRTDEQRDPESGEDRQPTGMSGMFHRTITPE